MRGKQLHVRVPVTPLEAYSGAKVAVPTPEGSVQLSIPAGSQNGSKLRLRGKGIQKKGKPQGDLIAHLEIIVPPGHSDEVEEALKTVQEAFEGDPRESLEL
jgi:curved DNA-binding protein